MATAKTKKTVAKKNCRKKGTGQEGHQIRANQGRWREEKNSSQKNRRQTGSEKSPRKKSGEKNRRKKSGEKNRRQGAR